MELINKKPIKITQNEMVEEEDMLENDMGDESEVYEEQEASGLSDESSSEDKGHPFPTPPPDADADTKGEAEPKVAMTVTKNSGPKVTVIAMTLAAIADLKSRSGSSVQAIVKYIKTTGYEVTDERRFSRTVLKNLKIAITKGEVSQVKRSFKLSEALVKKSKSMEKMKEKAVKKKLVNKQKAKAKSVETEQVDEGVKAKKVKMQTSDPKTTKPAKIKKIADQDAVKEDGNEKAKVTKKQALEPKTTQAVKAKKNGDLNGAKGEKAKNQKAKPARVSLGTLVQPNSKLKSIRTLKAGKAAVLKNRDDVDSDIDSEPTQASTPIATVKQRGKGRQRKAN